MSELKTWIILSKQVNPNDFYVKVDGSDFYTAFWIACAKTKESALSLAHEAISELDLGETEIIDTAVYNSEYLINDPDVLKKIENASHALADREDVQLATWVSSSGGLW